MNSVTHEQVNLRQVFFIAVFFSLGMTLQELSGSGLLSAESLAMSDPDTWLRLVLVKQLAMTGDWYNHLLSRLDPPIGMVSPWTRPVDVLLLLLSFPFIALMGLQEGLLYGTLLYSQGLMLGSVGLLILLYRRKNAPPLGYLSAIFLFLFAPLIFTYFIPLNADHHSLLIFLAIASMWAAERWVRLARLRDLLSLGATLGIGIWVSVEFVLPAAVISAWVFLPWYGGRLDARRYLAFTAVLVGVMTFGWLLEQPSSTRWETHYDALTPPYLLLGFAIMLATLVLVVIQPFTKTVRVRVGVSFLMYGLACAGVLLRYPSLLEGPLAETNEFMRENFLVNIIEMQPLFSGNPFLAACCILFWSAGMTHVWRRWQQGSLDRMTLLHAILATVFLVEGMLYRRSYYYAVPSTSLLVGAALAEGLATRAIHNAIKALLAVGISLLPVFAVIADKKIISTPFITGQDCSEELLIHLLDGSLVPEKENPGVWLVNPNLGAQVLYVTDARILASNYHRNQRGYESYIRLLRSRTDEEALPIIRTHDLRLVAFCEADIKENPFFARLADATTRPAWASPLEKLTREDKSLHLFRIEPSRLP